jgi:hypothetical protein
MENPRKNKIRASLRIADDQNNVDGVRKIKKANNVWLVFRN